MMCAELAERVKERARFDTRYAHLAGVIALGLGACGKTYQEPNLPLPQLALLEAEERAAISTVDGADVLGQNGRRIKPLWVTPGCHDVDVQYEESYVRLRGGGGILVWGLIPTIATLAASAGNIAAQSTVHTYDTDAPVHFHVPAKPGMKFWITSTFDGDVFAPRISVLDHEDNRVALLLPNQPCSAMAGPALSSP